MDREASQAIAERLKEKRISARLTQKDVASQIGKKITRQLVSAWERAETPPTVPQLMEVCVLYGTSADYLLFGVRPMREYSHPMLQRIFRPARPGPEQIPREAAAP